MTQVYNIDFPYGFLDHYQERQPNWGGALGYCTYKRTYARPLDDDGLSEEFWQTCARVVRGVFEIQKRHCLSLNLPWSDDKAQKSMMEMFKTMWDFKWSPPGRGLRMMGTKYVLEKGGATLNNCAFISTKDIGVEFSEPFTFLMDMSMLGVGVGFDTLGAGKVEIVEPVIDGEFVVNDDREGWIELIRRILNSYVGVGKLPFVVNYEFIRAYGAPIRGMGGTSSGPGPLMELAEELCSLLNGYVGRKLDSSGIVDIQNMIGKCIVSGNVRRSAEIAFGRYDDDDFLNLKSEWQEPELSNHRWASNNSVILYPGDKCDYKEVALHTACNGEPGYLWLDNARNYGRMCCPPDYKDYRAMGANPCGEQTLESYELCCLVETYPVNCDNFEDYKRVLKMAYMYAKSVTLIHTHIPKTNAIMMRNRRIGTSQSGITQNINKVGLREHLRWCDDGYNYIQSLDKIYSDWLAIPRSIKTTSIKPSGTVSLLPGVTPGIHFPHSEYYIRRVRFGAFDALLSILEEAGYKAEDCLTTPNTVIVEFPIKEDNFDRGKSDVTMWEQLELAAKMQAHWADNQVSATITFSEKEGGDIERALCLYENRLKGVSFLPNRENTYLQPPYEEITEAQYYEMIATIKPLDFSCGFVAGYIPDNFCDGGSCTINTLDK